MSNDLLLLGERIPVLEGTETTAGFRNLLDISVCGILSTTT